MDISFDYSNKCKEEVISLFLHFFLVNNGTIFVFIFYLRWERIF